MFFPGRSCRNGLAVGSLHLMDDSIASRKLLRFVGASLVDIFVAISPFSEEAIVVGGKESMRPRLAESCNPDTRCLKQTEAIVRDWERQYAVAAELSAVALKFSIKLAQDAVPVRTSAFYAVPLFETAAFQRKCFGGPPSWQGVAFVLQECESQHHETAIVARSAGPRNSQVSGATDVHTSVEWIDVTKGQNLDFSSKVKRVWSRILCKHSGDLTSNVRDAGRATLIRTWPRLDAVCMFLSRESLGLVKSESTLHNNLFGDGLREWKVCIFGRTGLRARWPLDSGPQTLASHPHRLARTECVKEAVGVGLEMLLVRSFFNSVRSVTTDMGQSATCRARAFQNLRCCGRGCA